MSSTTVGSARTSGRVKSAISLAVVALGLAALCTYFMSPRGRSTHSLEPPQPVRGEVEGWRGSDEQLADVEDSAEPTRAEQSPKEEPPAASAPSTAGQWQSPAALEAEAEIERIERLYARLLRQVEAGAGDAHVYAEGLLLHCAAVRLNAQGRGEPWQPSGAIGALPKIDPDERQFLSAGRRYQFHTSEFPLLARLEAESDKDEHTGQEATAGQQPLSQALLADIEAEMAATLSALSAVADAGQ